MKVSVPGWASSLSCWWGSFLGYTRNTHSSDSCWLQARTRTGCDGRLESTVQAARGEFLPMILLSCAPHVLHYQHAVHNSATTAVVA